MSKTPSNTIAKTGARSGDIVLGFHAKGNLGLLIQVFEEQPKNHGGRIRGPFRILHEGSGKYAAGIRAVMDTSSFFGQADEFIRRVASEDGCSDCTHVLNANALWRLDPVLIYDRIVNVEAKPGKEERVRRCVSCGQTYDDLTLNFCLQDGTPLSDEFGEVETVVMDRKNAPDLRQKADKSGIEYIQAAVASHPNLGLKIHPGSNHRITKSGHTGSVWIIPRHDGVSITANGQAAPQLYREMERLFGQHHREDVKGYRYFQANKPQDVEWIIEKWSKI